jgi:hypothetical protein
MLLRLSVTLRCSALLRRASKGDGPDIAASGAASFEARKRAHLRMTGIGQRLSPHRRRQP